MAYYNPHQGSYPYPVGGPPGAYPSSGYPPTAYPPSGGYPPAGYQGSAPYHSGHGSGMGAMLAGGVAVGAAAYGAHHLTHGHGGYHGHGSYGHAGYYGHGHGHGHGKFNHGKFKHGNGGMFGGKFRKWK